MHGHYRRRPGTLGVKLSQYMTGALGGYHGDIDVGRWHHLPVVDIKAVGEHQHLALAQPLFDCPVINIAVQVIRRQHDDNIGFLGHLGGGHHPKASTFGVLPARGSLGFTHYHLAAAVPKILGVGVSLAAVADNTYCFAL